MDSSLPVLEKTWIKPLREEARNNSWALFRTNREKETSRNHRHCAAKIYMSGCQFLRGYNHTSCQYNNLEWLQVQSSLILVFFLRVLLIVLKFLKLRISFHCFVSAILFLINVKKIFTFLHFSYIKHSL